MLKYAQRQLESSQAIPSQRERAAAPARVQPIAPSAILRRAALAPQSLRPPDIQRLQQTLGNRAVVQMLSQRFPSRSLVQAKLTINAPGDRYEQEADRVAEEVMQKPAVQRAKSEEDEDETPEVMTKPQPSSAAGGAFEANDGFERQLQAARGQGRPLPPALKENFETKFGADFGGVRFHANAQSDQMNRSIQARAFTTGQDVFFRQGAYQPESIAGQELVAHELTHVVQQSGGPQAGGVIQRDVGFEFETDWGIHGGKDPTKESDPPLKKHHSYKDYEGFEVQVDEASRGFKDDDYPELGFEIEFVVKPHAETEAGGDRLARTMKELLKVAREMEGKAKKYAKFRLREPGDKLWVFPEAKDTAVPDTIHARPQATVGLSLSAIQTYGLLKEEELRKREGTGERSYVYRGATLTTESSLFENIVRISEGMTESSKDFRGLVTLLALYICIFHDRMYNPDLEAKPKPAADYAKGVLPILAKTNFAFMFGQLGRTEQEKYSKHPGEFADLVLKIVNEITQGWPNVKKKYPVIPTHRVEPRQGSKLDKLTLKAWLKGIPKGEDKLTQAHYRGELFGFGNLGGKEGEGGTGAKADTVPVINKAAMVVEFRGGIPSLGGGFLLPEKWAEFAFDYYHLVRRLHSPEIPQFRRDF